MGWRPDLQEVYTRCRGPDVTVAGYSKRLASRFYQLKTGHCLAGQYVPALDGKIGPVLVVPIPDADSLRCVPSGRPSRRVLWAEVQKESGRKKSRCRIRDLLTDGRCS